MSSEKIYQIYYDKSTKENLDPGFIPLNNSNPTDNRLYEFGVILEYLQKNNIVDSELYGFLSPKFWSKTGLFSNDVHSFIRDNKNADAYLFTAGWDQIVIHKNCFLQGEHSHPGFLVNCKSFFDFFNINFDLENFISTFENTVYSNFIVANGKYWKRWLMLSQSLFKYSLLNEKIFLEPVSNYNSHASMLIFIQERLHSLLLIEDCNVKSYDVTKTGPIIQDRYLDNEITRNILRMCERLKVLYSINSQKTDYEIYKTFVEYLNSGTFNCYR